MGSSMYKYLLPVLLSLLISPAMALTFKSGQSLSGNSSGNDSQNAGVSIEEANALILDEIVRTPFIAQSCSTFFDEHIRSHPTSDCFVLAELNQQYEVPIRDVDINIWNTMMLLDAKPKGAGVTLHAFTYNNTVKWGTNSDARPQTHMVTLNINDLSTLAEKSALAATERVFALVPRRLRFDDYDNDGATEILLLANLEDGRLRSSSWRDRNYIYDFADSTLKAFGTPQFSHDLMIADFNRDGHSDILDHYYGVPGNPSGVEHCNLKTGECRHYFIDNLLDNGFTAFTQNDNGGIMFGPCANKGGLELCWLDVQETDGQLEFEAIAQHKLRDRPTDKATFLLWTGDIGSEDGTYQNKSKTIFNLLDRPWISHMTDFDGDGDEDTLAFDVEVTCKRPKSQDYFDKIKDCERDAKALFFENLDGKDVRLSQTIPVAYNGQNTLLTGDVNRDGLADIYGYRDQWHVYDCNRQFTMVFLNDGDGGFQLMAKDDLRNNFGQYGCENGSVFFKHGDDHYRLFTTQKKPGPSIAYLAIEKFIN